MTTILRASGAAELLSIIPTLAGFTPRHSLVILPFSGARTNGALRVDLPETSTPLDEFAASLIGLACRVPSVDSVAIAVYTDDPVDDDSALPHTALVDALLSRASTCALRIVEALCVGADAWGDYLDATAHRVAIEAIPGAPAVPGIADVSGDQSSGSELPRVDEPEKEQVEQALVAIEQLFSAADATAQASPDGAPDDGLRSRLRALSLDDLPSLFERVLDTPEHMSAFDTAALLWCLSRPLLRDVAIVQWARNLATGYQAFDAQLAFHTDHAAIAPELGDLMIGRGRRPDGDRLRLALAISRQAAAHAPREHQVGALATAGWLAWALGRSTHADHYVALAQQIEPTHSFCDILRTILDSGMLPEWAFHPSGTAAATRVT